LNKSFVTFSTYLNHVSLFTPGIQRAKSEHELFTRDEKYNRYMAPEQGLSV